ncbi:glycosyl hydrolase family 61-domain-containing protein [Mycena galopus ATCC 62051]|nr:glycosyl hydrolase family 61-domain-containing protein [Mycena galopus ATCC 62051]
MKSFAFLVTVATLAAKVSAHYVWPQLIVGGANTTAWEYVRQTNNWQDLNPVVLPSLHASGLTHGKKMTDVTSTDVRCYTSLESGTASTVSVAAGSTVGFTVSGNPSNLYHPGVLNVYMAKAPTGPTLQIGTGAGPSGSRFPPSQTVDRPSRSLPRVRLSEISFTIPPQTPSGQYLIRTEHIAIHSASYYGGAQFYIACAQVTVTGGGTGVPAPLLPSPEHTPINIYYPIPTNYTQPGPPVWTGGTVVTPPPVSSTGTTTATSSKATTTSSATTSSSKATTTSSATTSSSGSSTGTTAAQYGQCGGLGWTGPTAW